MAHTRKRRPTRPAPLAEATIGPVVGVLLDLENLLHDTRRVSGDAVRAGLRQVIDTVAGSGPRGSRSGCATTGWRSCSSRTPSSSGSAELATAADDILLIELDGPTPTAA